MAYIKCESCGTSAETKNENNLYVVCEDCAIKMDGTPQVVVYF